MSVLGGVIGALIGIQRGGGMSEILLSAVISALVAGVTVYGLIRMVPHAAGATMQATLMPSGNTTPYETDFSYESALAMKGDVKGALESLEKTIASQPANAAVRLKAAEMYLGAGNYHRSRELYREVQRIPGVDARDDVTASYRLIDLYRGRLKEPGKSLPEFRRLIERYPNSRIEEQAREALAKLKADMSF
jgi:tetratricopeptide (TPR) repeat protein